MKKIMLVLLLLCVGSFYSTVNVFAAAANGPDVVSAGQLVLGTDSATTKSLTIGLSPKVVGAYFTNGTSTGTAQWFTIGAAHPGGLHLYGTAQNLTNNYKKKFTPGTTINKNLFALPAVPDSADDWSTGWAL